MASPASFNMAAEEDLRTQPTIGALRGRAVVRAACWSLSRHSLLLHLLLCHSESSFDVLRDETPG